MQGVVVPIDMTYINNGDADYINPSVIIDAPFGNIISYTLEDLRGGIGESQLIVPLIEENGPAGILRAGASENSHSDIANSSPTAVYELLEKMNKMKFTAPVLIVTFLNYQATI